MIIASYFSQTCILFRIILASQVEEHAERQSHGSRLHFAGCVCYKVVFESYLLLPALTSEVFGLCPNAIALKKKFLLFFFFLRKSQP